MSLKQFSRNDIVRNSLITYPKYEFRVFNGKISSRNYVDGTLNVSNLLTDEDIEIYYGTLNFEEDNNSGWIAVI